MSLTYNTPLDPAALVALGIPGDWPFGIAGRVRFTELDALGHVNNARFLSWFEDFRIAYLPHVGVSDYGQDAPRLVLAEVGCRYLAEMRLGEDYVTCGRTRTVGTSSMIMDYAVYRIAAGGPVQTAASHAALALRTADGTAKRPIPREARARLLAEGATPR